MTGTLSVRMLVTVASVAAIAVAACLNPSNASAQVATGSIVGTVHDATGQIVPGASDPASSKIRPSISGSTRRTFKRRRRTRMAIPDAASCTPLAT